MVLGHPKSIGIPWVDGLLTGPLDLGRHLGHLNPLEGLDEGEKLRRRHRELNMLCVVVLPGILGGSIP